MEPMFFDLDFLKFADHMLTYGNYGGLNYSSGVVGGTITGSSPPDAVPVDPLDALFYQHDLVYQTYTDPTVLRTADVQLAVGVVEGVYDQVSADVQPAVAVVEGVYDQVLADVQLAVGVVEGVYDQVSADVQLAVGVVEGVYQQIQNTWDWWF
jgi:hypothetical protein